GYLVSGLIAAGPTLVECLYPGRFQDAGGYVQLLGAVVWFTMLQSAGEAVLLGLGRTRLVATAQVVKLAALPPLLYGGYELGGLPGMIVGFAAAEAVRYAMIAVAVRR